MMILALLCISDKLWVQYSNPIVILFGNFSPILQHDKILQLYQLKFSKARSY